MGNTKLLNGFADSAFWKKTELTKLSQLTNDSGFVTGGPYLPLGGGVMSSTANISWADRGAWGNSSATYPYSYGGLSWSGTSDSVSIFAREDSSDQMNLVIKFGDDSNHKIILNDNGTESYYLNSNGNWKASILDLGGVSISYGDSALRVTTAHGNAYFGMMNGSYCHIYTDGPAFYFNKSVYITGNTVLHGGNYNNFSPTLTGGGASGTWGINISGTAANANTLDNIDSTGFLQNYNQNYGSTISNATDISPTLTAGVAQVHISNIEYSSVLTGYDFNKKAWQLRFRPSYNDGIYFRSQGTGTAWKKLAFTSDIPSIPTSLPANGGNSDTVDNLHASDFKQVNVSNISYTPNLTHHGWSTINSSYYYKISISNVNNVWTMLYMELDIKENYASNLFGKLIIHVNKNDTNGISGAYGYISGKLSDSVKVYIANGSTFDIYIAGNWNYPTIDVSRVNFGDSACNNTKVISLSTSTTLPASYTTATIVKGLDSENYTNYTGFLRYYNSSSAPSNVDVVNTPSYVWTVSTTGGTVTTATKPSGMDNAWGVIHLHTHYGNYATQLGFGGTTGRMYMRNAYNTSTFGNWQALAFTSDIPTVTNYYWANVQISDKSNSSTSPTFANATTTGLLTVSTGGSHCGIKAGSTYINSINSDLILQNNGAIRFGTDSWDYNCWAGLKYVHSSKTISLGLADGTHFTANSAQSGGTMQFPGISNFILNGTVRIVPQLGSYQEGIRIQPKDNWSMIMLLGPDTTAAASGSSAKSWGIFNNDGNFYINRSNSSSNTGYELCNVGGNWGIGTISPSHKLHVSGDLAASVIYANRTGASDYGGVSLYYNTAPDMYGIMFRGTSNSGKYGFVTGDWAAYFTMNDDPTRGWIFRRGTTNVASISGGGIITANHLDLRGATNATMTYASTNPCIVFSENGGQCVKLLYTDYDSYRSPAGLKVIGDQGGEWFEVVGTIYGGGFYHNNYGSNAYVLTAGGSAAKIADLSVNYANSAGYTTRLYANSASDLITDPGYYSLSYSRFQSDASNIFPVNNNANGCITAHLHAGNYYAQIGLSSNGRMYYRTMMSQALNSGVGWNTVAWTSDIPTVTNYYWANLSVQASASDTTVPSFGAIRMNGVSSAGTNYITGTAGRIFFGGNFHIDAVGANHLYLNHYSSYNVYMCSGSSKGKVGIRTSSPSYPLHVSGDSYTTGWSRAASGFYVEDTGVHFTHQGTLGEIDMTSNNEFLWGSSSADLYFNHRAVSRGTTVTNYIWNAGSSSSYATHKLGSVHIYSNGSSYNESIRIHPSSAGWHAIVLCGTDNTGDSGVSTNTWGIYGNSGTMYLNKGNSSGSTNSRAMGTSTGWTFGNTDLNSYALNAASFICASWVRTKGSTGWYNEDYGGGWYMTDSTYVRVYNDKRVYNNNTSQYAFYTAGGMTASGNIYGARFVATASNSHQSNGGLILSNSDIWGLNAIYTSDLAEEANEGYQFKRSDNNYDSIWCNNGTFYFSPNGHPDSGYNTNYFVLHSGNFDGFYYTLIDASSLDNNTWYPVTISIGNSYQTNIRIQGHSSANASWNGRSDKRMSVILDYTVNGSNWGWTGAQRVVHQFQLGAGAGGSNCIAGIGQLTNDSTEYVYVRGGAKYHFYISRNITPVLRTSTYTGSGSQTVGPTTSSPTAIVAGYHDMSLYAPHFYENSDINLKKNIKAILDSDNIPVIKEFDWKSDGTHSYGLIAQELEEQGYSELVSDSGSHKTVNYSAALSLIVGKLQNKIKELEAEIENLKLRA
jgi:hypothetical protein